MDIIIENLLEQYKTINQKKNDKNTILICAFLTLSVIGIIVLYFFIEKFCAILQIIITLAIFIFLGICYILVKLQNKDKFKNYTAYLCKLQQLDIALKNETCIVKITNKEGYKSLLELAKKYYSSKFDNFDKFKKAISNITKLIIVPTFLLIAEALLSGENISDLNTLQTFSGFLLCVLLVLLCLYIAFELVGLLYLISNVRLKLFIKDLELLSSFDITTKSKPTIQLVDSEKTIT